MSFKKRLLKAAMEQEDQDASNADQVSEAASQTSDTPNPTATTKEDIAKHQQNAVSADEKQAHREDEIVFYAKMTNPDGLKLASAKEHHDQWEIKTQKGKVRVRKTVKDGLEPTYSMTFKKKSKNAGIDGSVEQTNAIDEMTFINFSQIANNGMIKDRFKFPVTSVQIKTSAGLEDIEVQDTFYEVDVFFNPDDTYNLYVKIDLEVNPILEALKIKKPDLGEFNLNVKMMDLPFKPVDVIISTNITDEQKQIVDRLYEEVFITKNRS